MITIAVVLGALALLGGLATIASRVELARAKRDHEQGRAEDAVKHEARAHELGIAHEVLGAALRIAKHHADGEDLISAIVEEVESDKGRDLAEHFVLHDRPPEVKT